MRAPVITEKRARIVTMLRERPGLSKTALARELGVDVSSVGYHLHVLSRARVVIVERMRKRPAFFVNGATTSEERRELLRADDSRRALEALRSTPGWHRCCDLAGALGLTRERTRNALRALEREGLARRSMYAHWEAIA